MSSKKATVAFADKILQHFPPFKWDEEKEAAWAETLVKELSGFPAEVIDRAAREMVRTRKKDKTPLVSECIEACDEARRWMEAEKRGGSLPIGQEGSTLDAFDWAGDRLRLANDLVMSPLGRQAAKEGWVGSLWSFIRKNMRMPEASKRIEYRKSVKAVPEMVSEIEFCKREARDFDESYAQCVRDKHKSTMISKLEEMGAEMLRRRRVLEQRVLGGKS